MTRLLLAAVAATGLLTGCSLRDEPEQTASGATANETADLTPEKGVNVAALWGGGKPMPLDVQMTHPSGMVLQLTSLQAKPTETVVGITVVNGDDDEHELNGYPHSKDGYIVSGTGEKFFLSPPATNPELSVAAGQRMEGELVFLGRLPKGQNALLILNDGDNLTNEYDTTPGFRLELPMQSAAFSDDGSKKN